MTAGQYCNREVVITESNITITEAAKLMRKHHVGDLVVVKKKGTENIPIGIVTDRDLVVEILAQEIPVESVTFRDIMNTDIVAVDESESLLYTLNLMQQRGVRRIMVVNKNNGLEGILSVDDAVELIAEAMNDLARLNQREVMHEKKKRP